MRTQNSARYGRDCISLAFFIHLLSGFSMSTTKISASAFPALSLFIVCLTENDQLKGKVGLPPP
jgi:hypothetical protein